MILSDSEHLLKPTNTVYTLDQQKSFWLSDDIRQGPGRDVLHLRRADRGPAHPHHLEELHRLLQEQGACRAGAEEGGRPGQGGGQRRVLREGENDRGHRVSVVVVVIVVVVGALDHRD